MLLLLLIVFNEERGEARDALAMLEFGRPAGRDWSDPLSGLLI